ncbi:MAG: sirohydrochlorin cobaltochelatase [Eubacteriales bacterium]|nr:sirohydrochlorin cobaltochelatase [Eubacteriales bacterium]
MRSAILFVSFGTSYREARENSLERIYEELKETGRGIRVFAAYTSGMIIKKVAEEEKLHIDTVQEAAARAKAEGIEKLYVIPSHMIPGMEYDKMVRALEQYRSSFREMKIATPVLGEEKDCGRVIAVLRDMLDFREENFYVLMGHGTEDDANIRYEQMNDALMQAGLTNVRIASVEARPDLDDALRFMEKCGNIEKVIVHPFMVVAGDHAHNDMAGEEDSYVTKIGQAGYPVCAVVKGLGEYPQFRAIYREKYEELIG